MEIEARYRIKFLEIGTDKDHVHFLVQSVPTYSVTRLVTIIKSLTARRPPSPAAPPARKVSESNAMSAMTYPAAKPSTSGAFRGSSPYFPATSSTASRALRGRSALLAMAPVPRHVSVPRRK